MSDIGRLRVPPPGNRLVTRTADIGRNADISRRLAMTVRDPVVSSLRRPRSYSRIFLAEEDRREASQGDACALGGEVIAVKI